MEERVQKILSQAGVTSRRDAEQFIKDGRVAVNGKTVTELGSKADPEKDEITVDGTTIASFGGPKVIIMMHKPEKVMVTASDPQGRPTVYSLLEKHAYKGSGPKKLPRVYPVGRLDYDAEGLLFLTNDGELADALAHPRKHVPKTYLAKVRGVVDEKGLKRMQQGMHLRMSDGSVVKTQPAEIELHRKVEKNAWYSITVFEGKNRLIKRLFQAVGHPVRRLLRIEFGGVKLGELPEGEWRELEDYEEKKLRGWILDKGPQKLVSTKNAHGRRQTTQAQGRSGKVSGKGARRQGARNIRKGPRTRSS